MSNARRGAALLALVLCACSDDGASPGDVAFTAQSVRVGFQGMPAGIFAVDSLGEPVPSLVALTTPVPFVDLQLGVNRVCGLDAQGTAWCWGDNRRGLLGTGSSDSVVTVPEPVRGAHRFVALQGSTKMAFLDADATCGVDAAAVAWCRGVNPGGQLGVGDQLERAEPTAARGLPPIAAITRPAYTTCAVDREATVRCWGANHFRQANPVDPARILLSPAVPVPEVRFRAVTNSWQSACGLSTDGVLWCWGQMAFWGDTTGPPLRVTVDGESFVELATNGLTIFGRTSSGAVYFWAEYILDGFKRTPKRLPFPVPMTTLAAGDFPVGGRQDRDGVCGVGVDAQVYCSHAVDDPGVWRLTHAGLVPDWNGQ